MELGTKPKTGPAEDCLNGHDSRLQEAWCSKQEGHESDSEGSWKTGLPHGNFLELAVVVAWDLGFSF